MTTPTEKVTAGPTLEDCRQKLLQNQALLLLLLDMGVGLLLGPTQYRFADNREFIERLSRIQGGTGDD